MNLTIRPDRQPGVRESIRAKKIRQTTLSVPHYVREVRDCRSVRDVRDWVYYKAPWSFRLRPTPSALSIEITNDCNFGCPHCPRSELNLQRDIHYMPVELLKKIADDAVGRTPIVKVFGLGEPALHPHLDAIMAILRERRFNTYLYTNGTLFQRWSLEDILSWELGTLVVSIDGTDEKSFGRLRVGGDHTALLKDVKAFRRARDRRGRTPTIEVRHVIMPNESNVEIKGFEDRWRRQGADTVRYNALMLPYSKAKVGQDEGTRPRCRDIRRDMHIRADGRVPLCGYDGHKTWIGDLRSQRIDDVWNGAIVTRVRQAHDTRDLSKLPACQSCQFR